MRPLPAIISAVIIAAALSGCQAGEPADSPAGRPPADQTEPPRGSKITLPDDPESLAKTLEDRMRSQDGVRFTVSSTAEGEGGGAPLRMTGAIRNPNRPKTAAAITTVENDGGRSTTTGTVYSDRTIYVKTEGEEFEPGKPWMRFSRKDLDDPAFDDPEAAKAKAFLERVLSQTEHQLQVGAGENGLAMVRHGRLAGRPTDDTIGAEELRRYQGSTDTAELAEEVEDPQVKILADGGVQSLSWTAWVTSDGLLRQITNTMKVPGKGSITTKTTYTGWGEPVKISLPPESQVAGFSP